MIAWITSGRIQAATGIEDRRVLANGVATYFPTGMWATGIELVDAIVGPAAARALGVSADPTAMQDVRLTIDAIDEAAVRSFWWAVLGCRERDGDVDLLDSNAHGPSLWFHSMDAPRSQRDRVHVEGFVPHDAADARVAASLAAGGHLVTDAHAPTWWVLADAKGNEVCVAPWMGRD